MPHTPAQSHTQNIVKYQALALECDWEMTTRVYNIIFMELAPNGELFDLVTVPNGNIQIWNILYNFT